MGSFKLYDCDVGVLANGIKYVHDHVDEVQVEDPERNNLTRGANATNTTGLTFREGLKEPKRWTMMIKNLTPQLAALYNDYYKNQKRLDVFCAARSDGSNKMLRNAIIANKPQQLTLDDTPDSMNVSIEFVSFICEEVHKS